MDMKISVTDTFQQFSAEDWVDWIDDILNNKFAFPANRFSAEGDPLIDVVDYLRRNAISGRPYEEAVCKTIPYYLLKSKTPLLERLVSVMAYTRSPRYKKKMLELYMNKGLDDFRGVKDYLKSKLLSGLVTMELEDEERNSVKDFISLSGFSVVDFDPAFIGHYLGFIREQHGSMLFQAITQLCDEIPFEGRDNNFRLRIVNVVMDVLDQFHFYNNVSFYQLLFDWLIDSFAVLNRCALYKEIVEGLKEWFSVDKLIRHEIHRKNSLPAFSGYHTMFLLDVLTLDEAVMAQSLEKIDNFFEFLKQGKKLQSFRAIAADPIIGAFFKTNLSIYKGCLSYLEGSPRYYLYEEYEVKSVEVSIFLERLLLNSRSPENIQSFLFP